jgi:hypothetical protein
LGVTFKPFKNKTSKEWQDLRKSSTVSQVVSLKLDTFSFLNCDFFYQTQISPYGTVGNVPIPTTLI